MNTQENSKLIDNFMESALHPMSEKMHIRGLNGLDYHSSWDWLMPVVEKIEKLNVRYACDDRFIFHMVKFSWVCQFTIWPSELTEKTIILKQFSGENRLIVTYQSVVEFIKWYNQNK